MKSLPLDFYGFPAPYGPEALPGYAPLLSDGFGSFAPELAASGGDTTTGVTGQVWLVHGQAITVYITITAAIAAASAGDLLIVWNGSYAEAVTVDKALTLRGTSEGAITISSSAADTKVLTVTAAARIERLALEHTGAGGGGTYGHGVDVSGADDIVLDHVKVRKTSGAVSNVMGIYRYGTNTGVIIEDADVEVSSGSILNYAVYLAGGSTSGKTITIKRGRFKASGGTSAALYVDQVGLTVNLEGPVLDGAVTLVNGTLQGWYMNSTGDIVLVGSSVLPGLDKAKVSRLAASDGSPDPAASVDAAGLINFTTDGARVYHSAAQATTSGVYLVLAFDSERYDTNGLHSTTVNNSRLTAKRAGKHIITAAIEYDANATGLRDLVLRANGGTLIIDDFRAAIPTYGTRIAVSTIYHLAANEYVEVLAYQNSGGNLNVAASPNYSAEFAMHYLGD